MRICLYTETALPATGGQAIAVDALARQFLLCGHEAVVLTLRKPRRARWDDGALGYPVMRHPHYLSSRIGLGWYRRYIEAVYRAYPFNVLHCHNVYPAGYVAVAWAAARGIPVVLTSHGPDLAPQNPLLHKPKIPLRISGVLQQADAVVAISKAVQERCFVLGAEPDRTVRIGLGVDCRRYASAAPRPNWLSEIIRPGRYFLFLDRLVPHTGADLLLEAYRALGERRPIHLVICGEGEQRSALMAQVAFHQLEGHVHFVGAVGEQERAYLQQNALCTVIPARAGEDASRQALESYAAGVSVIATQLPGLDDAVRPRVTGLLVAPASVSALTDALACLAADRARAHAWGLAAQKLARRFDWRRIALQHLELYGSLSGRSVRPRAAA